MTYSTPPSLLDAFLHLKRWKRGSELAPHKPLVVLFALGRVARGEPRLFSFDSAREQLSQLLAEFGPSRASHHPSYPFWRLQNDRLGWEVVSRRELRNRASNTDPPVSELLSGDARAGFSSDVHTVLATNPELVDQVATAVLDQFFPATLHDDIRAAVGLSEGASTRSTKRDQHFRLAVLRAYSFRCAVCGFDGKLDTIPLAIGAAHIKWHQWGGPGSVDNGVALCSLHHKVFDKGAITIVGATIEIAKSVHGSAATKELLLRYHGRTVELPRDVADHPKPLFLAWHRRNVFRG